MLSSPDLPIRELARQTGISTWTLYDWRKQAVDKGNAAMGSVKHQGQVPGGKRTASAKLAIITETSGLNEAELSEYCRTRGLYPGEVKAWQRAAEEAMAGAIAPVKELREALAAEKKRNKELERELSRKEKALAETAALLILRKKAAAIWGEGEEP